MSIFRAEEIKYCQVILPLDVAYDCVAKLGELECVSFKDMCPYLRINNRRYVREISRCYNLLLYIKQLKHELKIEKISSLVQPQPLEIPQPRDIAELESILEPMKADMATISSNTQELKKTLTELLEMQAVLERSLLTKKKARHPQVSFAANYDMVQDRSLVIDFSYLSGVIPVTKLRSFEKMLWRVTRGNLIYQAENVPVPFEDPKTGSKIHKAVFKIFIQSRVLEEKVIKVCNGFHATLYPYPKHFDDCVKALEAIMQRISEVKYVMQKSNAQRRHILKTVAKCIYIWEHQLITATAIYSTLDLFNFDIVPSCLVGECWVPINDVDRVRNELKSMIKETNLGTASPIIVELENTDEPPTFHRLNKFTKGFQALIDAYGVASYREMNPAPYTIVTFPFLFAVMFGDFGHGIIVFCFALWLVMKEHALTRTKTDNEMWNIMFAGRYIILMMGFFSMFTGLIYNDIFSKSINFFGSSWVGHYDEELFGDEELIQLDPNTIDFIGQPHPFGFDPVWQVTHGNKIIMYNAFKMKVSIILGVCHMIFGIALSLVNYRNFGNVPAIWCEFVPQLIFFTNIFVYLVSLMFYKWIKYDAATSSCAPSILITFINMLMFKSGSASDGCDPYMYPNQETVQRLLVYIALICIPWMLFAKPLYIYHERRRQSTKSSTETLPESLQLKTFERSQIGEMGPPPLFEPGDETEEEPMSEICIHQVILTIEFVLGSISHTASYLRLWALSLAHAQLTEVLWNMVLQKAFGLTTFFAGLFVPVFFMFWAIASVLILIVMEGLSAFLHTLRLHWVEFQSKFYIGQGYMFEPFSTKKLTQDIKVV